MESTRVASHRSSLNDGTGDLRPIRRDLSLAVPRVEVRFYRRSRTSADPIKKPAHFEYLLRCEWTGSQRPDLEFGSAEDLAAQAAGESYWWDSLPSSYVLKRRWGDFQRFHNAVVEELTMNKATNFRRVKARIPKLPPPGELDTWIASVAATGDALALNRPKGLQPTSGSGKHAGVALEDLDLLHTMYVENRLAPYLTAVSKVLAELPTSLLQESSALRKFVTSGVSCRVRPSERGAAPKARFFGPGPLYLETAECEVAAKMFRKTLSEPLIKQVTTVGLPVRPTRPAPPPAAPKAPPAAPNVTYSPDASPRGSQLGEQGGIRRSSSAGFLAEASLDSLGMEFSRSMTSSRNPDKMAQRLASSHYGFFANKLTSKEHGCASGRDFWNRMVVKERRELGRRTMLFMPGEDLSQMSTSTRPPTSSCSRLPALPPAGPMEFRSTSQEPSASNRTSTQLPKQTLVLSPKKEMGTTSSENARKEVVLRDLSEGLRMTLLGDPVPQVPRSIRLSEPIPVYPLPDMEQTMKVYKHYCHLLSEEGETPVIPASEAGLGGCTDDLELLGISWPSVQNWAQHLEDLAEDFRFRSVAAALNRALNLWRRNQASPSQRKNGVSLAMLIQWIWPSVTPDHIANMMTWICMMELDKFRQTTPRVIEPQDRRILESIFERMDVHKKGSVSPEDIAGGKDMSVTDRLKNIVDADTVKAVIGHNRIGLVPFLELMCENAFRGHDRATQVLLSDGRKLVQQDRKATGLTIWVFDQMTPDEEQPRRLADAFEAEALRWRLIAAEAKALAQMQLCQDEPLEDHDIEDDPDLCETDQQIG
mmetsp:Transcript_5623/g.10559  ORF Transcript_5623/g.10559 Transcript_5623/m.10559 type:complete len:819 (+) Transcript_5623:76-2532(+)